jgi:hypothetical protein
MTNTFEYLNEKKYSIFLFYSSFCMLFASIIAYIMDDKYITMFLIIVFLTSINHWRRPEYGLRRNIDLLIVYICVGYTVLRACLLKNEFTRYFVLSMLFCGLVFYFLEYLFIYLNMDMWIILHMTMHLYLSLMVIYALFD